MDSQNQTEIYTFPFNLLPEETLKHIVENIKLKIISTTEDVSLILAPLCGRLVVTDNRIIWYTLNREMTIEEKQISDSIQNQHVSKSAANELFVNDASGKSIVFSYNDLVSHGINQQQLQCFLGREEPEDFEERPVQQQTALLTELNGQLNPADLISLSGHYQVYNLKKSQKYKVIFGLENLSKEQQDQLFERVTECAIEYPMSEEPDAQEGWGDMITADQIDNDGNIIDQNEENCNDWQEDDDSDMEEEKEGKNQ